MNEEQLAKFAGKERTYIETLERRLQYLRDDPGISTNGYVAAESHALGWVLDIVLAGIEPLDTRVQRLEQQMRKVGSRIGIIERDLRTDVEDDS